MPIIRYSDDLLELVLQGNPAAIQSIASDHIDFLMPVLSLAIKSENLVAFSMMLKAIPKQSRAHLEELLDQGVRANSVECVRFLLSSFYTKEMLSLNNDLICNAGEFGYSEMIKLLVRYGANVDADNSFPLEMAMELHHEDAVFALLSVGADPTKLPVSEMSNSAFSRFPFISSMIKANEGDVFTYILKLANSDFVISNGNKQIDILSELAILLPAPHIKEKLEAIMQIENDEKIIKDLPQSAEISTTMRLS